MKIARLPYANDWTLLIFNSSYGNTKFFTGKTSYNISINPAVPVIIFPSNDFFALNSIIVKNLTKSQYGQLGSTQKSVIYMSCADLMSQNQLPNISLTIGPNLAESVQINLVPSTYLSDLTFN